MNIDWDQLPPLPEIGHPESYYAKQVHAADRIGNVHAREANKVGQYVTLALDPRLDWDKKLRYFRHAIRGHCNPPPMARDKVWSFYADLANIVRRHAGVEALKIASREDDRWARQLKDGVPRPQIMTQAAMLFRQILGDKDQKPEHLNQEDYEQLRILRNQWL